MGVISGCFKPVSDTPFVVGGAGDYTNLKLAAAGAGPAVVEFYDGQSITDTGTLIWVLDSSTTSNDSDKFDGLVVKKGLIAKMVQGAGLNAVVCVSRRHFEV